MGKKNYLIEGVSGSGKTSVCLELRRRGYHALNGDRDLAYKGDPATGFPVNRPDHKTQMESVAWMHAHQIWDVAAVRSTIADKSHAMSFFCGGSRNFNRFIDLFDRVFVLDVDLETLHRRLAVRSADEFGGQPVERDLIVRLHTTKEDIPKDGVVVDATAPLEHVVDQILEKCS